MELDRAAIADTDLAQDGPYMRALIASRYEMAWRACQPHMDGTLEEQGWKPDARYVIAGIRALQGLSRLYRLDQPQTSPDKVIAGTGPDTRALVAGMLDEVERREKV